LEAELERMAACDTTREGSAGNKIAAGPTRLQRVSTATFEKKAGDAIRCYSPASFVS
jgi:hypothetical protein